jgi:predicted amidohydrolase
MKMKRLTISGIALAVGLIAAVGTAAAITHYPTTVDATGTFVGPGPNRFIEYGQVHSSKAACRADRRLKMTAHYPNGSTKVLDTDRSSANGAYAMVGDFTNADGGKIRAAQKRIGRPGHRRICDAGSVPAD